MQTKRSGTTSTTARKGSGPAARPAPPPPHDPSERELLLRVGEWEVRRFPADGKLFAYAAPRGMLHVQLWHPGAGVSVLTPSRITGGHYEAYPIGGWKGCARDWARIATAIRREHRLEDPLVYEFRGDRTFAPRRLSDEERSGARTQAVYQVDESPRYESAGRWTHFANAAAWSGGETWRPLPRREHTKRSDDDVLVGTTARRSSRAGGSTRRTT